MKIQHLRTGEYGIARSGEVLFTSGVGSCVVVCLWDSFLKIGAMAHLLLPKDDSNDCGLDRKSGLSPDTTIPILIRKMATIGTDVNQITARLVGAGNMFPESHEGFISNIGNHILANTKQILASENIPVSAMLVGGKFGRQVHFMVSTGIIEVTSVNGDKSVI